MKNPTEDGIENLDEGATREYRGLVARANYMSLDRPDISFCVKELARKMSNPNVLDWQRLVRLARYLKGAPRFKIIYEYQADFGFVAAVSDTDWAGCRFAGANG